MFYEIREGASGRLKGWVLGTCHRLNEQKLKFTDAPDIFDSNSKVQNAFAKANVFATEFIAREWCQKNSGILDIHALAKFVAIHQFMDGRFELDAIKSGKQMISLRDDLDVFPSIHHLDTKIDLKQAFIEGSEETFTSHNEQGLTPRTKETHGLRNKAMTDRMDSLLRQENSFPFATMGAAHLAGPGSVCDLLKGRGWKIQRIHAKSSP